jgi:hypothetical protein
MHEFTVIGFWNNNGQPFIRAIDCDAADNGREAACVALQQLKRLNETDDDEDMDASVVEVLFDGYGVLNNESVLSASELLVDEQQHVDWPEKFARAQNAQDACGIAHAFLCDVSDADPNYEALVTMLDRWSRNWLT